MVIVVLNQDLLAKHVAQGLTWHKCSINTSQCDYPAIAYSTSLYAFLLPFSTPMSFLSFWLYFPIVSLLFRIFSCP